jgi:hypothetical protein
MTPDVTKIGKQNFDTLAAIQKQVLDALAKGNQELIDQSWHQLLPRR